MDDRVDDDLDVLAPTPLDRLRRWLGPPRAYRLTRSLLLRLLGVVYLFAFIGLTRQALPLLGSHGLTPAAAYLDKLAGLGRGFWDEPTLFWIDCGDGALTAAAWLGVVLAVIAVAGFANGPVMLLLWAIYGSFVHVGQTWFAFGWEIQLLETGFLAIFLAPPLDPRPLRSRPPPLVMIVLYRWLIVRIMLGAGLIKLRGDACWSDLSCLDYHFETQPLPNPMSPWFHRLPHAVHAAGVVFNHVVEVGAPWFAFGPRRLRLIAGALMAGFQLTLIVSGNLAFLNWLTLVPIVACLDDDALRWLAPARARAWLDARTAAADAAGR
ncbi:MAG: lipase maturation factor family protein, partial [Myxococcales bacterium]|nr:lipase maturation factor family protein [Myxococcales bacterium]